DTVSKIRAIDENIGIMIASGITTAEDVYNVVRLGADGTGGTSGILSAPDPVKRIREMVEAILQAEKDRKTEGEA
ncbi:MAG: triose-phosphate isomerase, partial [Eubacterium aggregans]